MGVTEGAGGLPLVDIKKGQFPSFFFFFFLFPGCAPRVSGGEEEDEEERGEFLSRRLS